MSSVTQGICSCLPDVTPAAHRALYETVVDFYEAEREAGDGGDDELYVKRTSYGQVHRLAELWNLLVSVGRFAGVSCSVTTSSTRGSSLREVATGVST